MAGPPPAQVPTLVFLHEGLGSIGQWRDFPARLVEATGCGALIYNRWGYGRSDPLEGPRPIRFMHDEAREALPAVLAAVATHSIETDPRRLWRKPVALSMRGLTQRTCPTPEVVSGRQKHRPGVSSAACDQLTTSSTPPPA